MLEGTKTRYSTILKCLMIVALALLIGCGPSPFRTRLNAPGSGPRGALQIRFSVAVENITVLVDGKMAVDDEKTDTIHITGVPLGSHHVRIIAGGDMQESVTYEEDIDVSTGAPTTLVLKAPNLSSKGKASQVTGYVFAGILAVVPWVLLIGLL